MTKVLLPEFIARHVAAQRERQAVRDRLWAERNAQVALIQEMIPGFGTFGYDVEVAGRTQAAVDTGVLQKLMAEGYATTFPEHLTTDKLRSGCAVWAIEWLAPQVLTVDTEKDNLVGADSIQRVTMTMKIDITKRLIDTEFFSWNSRVGTGRSAFEDTEKFHIVWHVPEGAETAQLWYVGFGSNEPHDLEHPEKLSGVAPTGKPRFYIYDAAIDRSVVHDVTWIENGVFDWDWTHVPARRECNVVVVEFVRFPDGSLHCLSDRYLASAAAGLTRDMLLADLWHREQHPGDPPTFEDLDSRVQNDFSALFVRLVARVGDYKEISPCGPAPALENVIQKARRDYLAYFIASAGVEARKSELVSAWKMLRGARGSQYASILDAGVDTVFIGEVASKLPPTLSDVLTANLASLDPELSTGVSAWRDRILEEIRADLYFYGQFPDARVGRLLFAVELAMGQQYGAPYHAILNQAITAINGGTPHGVFDINLPEPVLAAHPV